MRMCRKLIVEMCRSKSKFCVWLGKHCCCCCCCSSRNARVREVTPLLPEAPESDNNGFSKLHVVEDKEGIGEIQEQELVVNEGSATPHSDIDDQNGTSQHFKEVERSGSVLRKNGGHLSWLLVSSSDTPTLIDDATSNPTPPSISHVMSLPDKEVVLTEEEVTDGGMDLELVNMASSQGVMDVLEEDVDNGGQSFHLSVNLPSTIEFNLSKN